MRTEPASLRDTKFEAINMIAANSALLRVIVSCRAVGSSRRVGRPSIG